MSKSKKFNHLRIHLLIVNFLILTTLSIRPAQATLNLFADDGMNISTGSITAIKRNTLEIYDEQEKTIKSFVYVLSTEEFRVGEKVRVFYNPRTKNIQAIRKMTVVTYKNLNKNNGGYILQKE